MDNKTQTILSQMRDMYRMYGRMEDFLGEALDRAYNSCEDNWNESVSALPPIDTLETCLHEVVDSSILSEQAKNEYRFAILSRIRDFYRTVNRKVEQSQLL